MKVMAVIGHMSQPGGAERQMSYLLNTLVSQMEVVLVTMGTDHVCYQLDKAIRVIGLEASHATHHLVQAVSANLKRVRLLKQLIRQESPDCLISFLTENNVCAILAARQLDVPLLIAERAAETYGLSLPWRILRRVLYPYARLIVQTQRDRANYPYLKQVSVLANTYDPHFVNQIPVNQRPKVILTVGRLDYLKGTDMLIRAFKALPDGHGYELHIIGDGPEKQALKAMANGQIVFKGAQEVGSDCYNDAQIFALCSRSEGFPNVLLEAMACGCACLSTDCDYGPRELIRHQDNGWLCPVDDCLQIQQALRRLITDSDMRTALSEQATIDAQDYAQGPWSGRWHHVIQQAVQSREGTEK